jgi:penicillin-binding protein 1A
LVRINPTTGALARPDEKNAILEAYKPGTEPGSSGSGVVVSGNVPSDGLAIDNSEPDGADAGPQRVPTTGTGGLY